MTTPRAVWRAVGRSDDDAAGVVVVDLDGAGEELARTRMAVSGLVSLMADGDSSGAASRWIWNDTRRWYPAILEAGVDVVRCHDLRLCHAILRSSELVTAPEALRAATGWDADGVVDAASDTLFDFDDSGGVPDAVDEVVAEFARQRSAVDTSVAPVRLRLLLAAESAGALVAEELRRAGLPWSRAAHHELLEATLGPRPAEGARPAKMAALAAEVGAALEDPAISIDSQQKLLRALHRAGVLAESTSRWELARYEHPAIAPLLAYKRLARLYTANGWAWADEWIDGDRFRPVYVPAGVVTGRWASSGGGALQIPRQLRHAARADDGWVLVSADAAQLEPRVLAGLAADRSLAAAARGADLYEGIVASGAVATRQDAKFAILGAMYGATTGESGRLLPALRRAYPRAMNHVDAAARRGSEGGVVSTWLGRTAPPPGEGWRESQSRASEPGATASDQARARRSAADRGRFTRNFVVQGTAAEWALAWLADLRLRLRGYPPTETVAHGSGALLGRRPHLAFFLHDEVIVHAPAEHADAVAADIRAAASAAGRLLFGDFPIEFILDVRVGRSAAKDDAVAEDSDAPEPGALPDPADEGDARAD